MNLAALLVAIAMVESGMNDDAVGRRGERTRWQMLPVVWQQYSRVRMAEAGVAEAKRVATAHVGWLQRELRGVGRDGDVWWLAVAWNGGVRRAKVGDASEVPGRVRDYADRVQRVYGWWMRTRRSAE